jgi:hypothetical protein
LLVRSPIISEREVLTVWQYTRHHFVVEGTDPIGSTLALIRDTGLSASSLSRSGIYTSLPRDRYVGNFRFSIYTFIAT